ncbi:rhodanese-like domain-containing protein [Actinomadura logoneensis]|uniref:Rhodanese-like domain-containing protein n=1 Tax=Actinomadura logoneensis TaxID=2293572 RepID=A0A372JI71_9ACTN|nr:rhodanese-like domain-containing protein [Actinomadura logoneensis]RFU39554.1 rhodanese-like domain-containing protein [Actinomadura logoneensis]
MIFERLFGSSGGNRISPEQARRRVADGEAVLLDVREGTEWKAGHAPEAVHLPLSRLASGAKLPAAARNKPVVVICRSGGRSRQAAQILAGRGVDAVDVAGGMSAWARAGLPVTGPGGRPGTVA